MNNRLLLTFLCTLFSFGFSTGQHFDQLKSLIKEKESLKISYEKAIAQAKASKSKKSSAEVQEAFDKLMAKDAEIIQEISKTEAAVANELQLARKNEKIKTIIKGDKSLYLVIDSLSGAFDYLQLQYDSLLQGTISNNSFQASLQNELRNSADQQALIQKELDSVKTDKFILARRNQILLYFNMGVGALLFMALVYTLLTFRRKKRPSDSILHAEQSVYKPRPVTGFNQQVGKIALDAFDSKLEKIEMLGKLREKGLLTEDEFNLQKQQLLGNKPNS